ncbi:MAG: hypothetical protein K9L56_11910 [Clostridiales bacterium]|nr:hypothetical protein [Clostridiales bacterium]
MKLKKTCQVLIDCGYHPGEIEYVLNKLVKDKNSKKINEMEDKILLSMLQEKLEIARAESKVENYR